MKIHRMLWPDPDQFRKLVRMPKRSWSDRDRFGWMGLIVFLAIIALYFWIFTIFALLAGHWFSILLLVVVAVVLSWVAIQLFRAFEAH